MRNMSFMLTPDQILDMSKTVTRRNGWRFLKRGDLLQAVNKCQGLKKGEHPIKLRVIRVEDVRFESLAEMWPYECALEGFPQMPLEEFIQMFIKSHKGVDRDTEITRIRFSYVEDLKRLF